MKAPPAADARSEHEDMRKCTQSPGVGAYDIKDPDAHKLGLGAPVFGNEPRPFELEDNGVPGPGAHKEPDITKRSDVRNSQRYSMAAGIRSDVAPAHSLAIPGPGTYDHLQPLLTQSSTKKTPKSLSMGPGSLNKAGAGAFCFGELSPLAGQAPCLGCRDENSTVHACALWGLTCAD